MNFSRQNQNEELLNKFQKDLMAINSQVTEEKLVKYRLQYQDSDEKLNSSIIGKIFYNNFRRVEKYESQLKGTNMDHDEIINKINSSKYEVVELNVSPQELIVLQNNQLAAFEVLIIYGFDENFEQINKIIEIGGTCVEARGLAVNERNEVYILGFSKIIFTDAFFTKIIKELDFNELNHSCSTRSASICYKNNNLYLSDYNNKTIHILNRELDLVKSILLDYNPYKIQASNETFCISSGVNIYFYSLEDFKLKNKYENVDVDVFIVGYIANINSNFYCTGNKGLMCFNSNGELVEKMDLKQKCPEIQDDYDISILIYNNNLILSNSKKLIKFD